MRTSHEAKEARDQGQFVGARRLPAANIGLIVKGTIQGTRHGLLYNRATRMYDADQAGFGPFTRAELVARALAGDTLTIMGVPPATRRRMAINRNTNGVLDGDETLPALTAARSDGGAVISWPTNTMGVVLVGIQREPFATELENGDKHSKCAR
ncbi:MAG: hypothetical protein L0Z50_29960 [Verrucomicrobiales bacterium]|nr:hypothetical protein [Verrucomicrobiales bacterium]